jgi:translation initiation factor 3 subunit E
LNDPFLGKRIEEGNFVTVPLRDEFLENARLFIFETYCRIHRCIDIRWVLTLTARYNDMESIFYNNDFVGTGS